MDVKDRRNILGGLAAMLAAPFFLGRDTLVHAMTPRLEKKNPGSLPAPRISPPDHSVKRRG